MLLGLQKASLYLIARRGSHPFVIETVQDLLSAIEDRGLKIGRAMFQELIGLRKPVLDKNKILHWPVLLLYAEVMSSDFIEDFCETDMFSAHLDMISIFLAFSFLYFKYLALVNFASNALCP